MNGISTLRYAIIALLLNIFIISGQAQVPYITDCGTYTAGLVPCGNSYTDTYNGVTYHCNCICGVGGGAECTVASSGGSGGSSGTGGYIPGQTNPGDVSTDNIMEGKAIFTPHQSQAFTDWADDYKQLLESYGITSLLGQKITPNMPSTGNKDWDDKYKNKCDSFNPKVIKPKEIQGVVKLLTTTAQQANRDKWYQDQLQHMGYGNLAQISDDGITDGGSAWNYQKTQHLIFVGLGLAATATVLLAAAPEVATVGLVATLTGAIELDAVGIATVVSWSLPVVEQGLLSAEACASGPCPSAGTTITNMAVGEISNVVGTVGDVASGYAAVSTMSSIGTISTHGVNNVKYVWNAVFGATDTGVSIWSGLK